VTPLLTVAQLDALHRRHRGDRNFTRTVAEAVASGSAVLERAGARNAASLGNAPLTGRIAVVRARLRGREAVEARSHR